MQYLYLLNIDLFQIVYHHVLMLEILQYAIFVKHRFIPDRVTSFFDVGNPSVCNIVNHRFIPDRLSSAHS